MMRRHACNCKLIIVKQASTAKHLILWIPGYPAYERTTWETSSHSPGVLHNSTVAERVNSAKSFSINQYGPQRCDPQPLRLWTPNPLTLTTHLSCASSIYMITWSSLKTNQHDAVRRGWAEMSKYRESCVGAESCFMVWASPGSWSSDLAVYWEDWRCKVFALRRKMWLMCANLFLFNLQN